MYLYAIVDPKSKEWLTGLNQKIPHRSDKSIWIHCASLGEYNQAKPLLSILQNDGYKILLTFFSPSGYKHVKTDHPYFYLPLDTYSNAKDFIERINPTLAIFVRSEYWFNYLGVLDKKKIPLVFLNCYLSENQYLFNWYGKWFLNRLKPTSYFYTINDSTSRLLNSVGYNQNKNLGDTKVDHVNSASTKTLIPQLHSKRKKIILAASIEIGDYGVVKKILEKYQENTIVIIVPHEPTMKNYKYLNQLLNGDLIKYSKLVSSINPSVIYVDIFGLLSSLYQIAWVSYIGGGFNKGVHNILESCIESKPMIFGPKHNKFPEAQELINYNAAISISQTDQILSAITNFENESKYQTAQLGCRNFIKNHKGATQKIYNHLKQNVLAKWTLPILKNRNIVIIGDVMLDQFYYGNLEDSSKEDPLAKILKVNSQTHNLGGAGNVATNIKSLQSIPHLISVIGEDIDGQKIISACKENNIDTSGIFIDKERRSTVKTRLYDDDQIIRFDQENINGIPLDIESKLIFHFRCLIESLDLDGVILQDYNKGVLNKSSIKKIIAIAKVNQLPIFVDPKKDNFFEYEGVNIFKPNLREISWALPSTTVEDAAAIILERLACETAIITLSERGMYFKNDTNGINFPTLAESIVDVCGAGDTVIAVLCLTYISKCNINLMGTIANLAAANVCQSRGVIPIDYDNLTELYTSHHQDKEKNRYSLNIWALFLLFSYF